MYIRPFFKLILITLLLGLLSACSGSDSKHPSGKAVFKNLSTGNSATDYAITKDNDDQANPRTVYLPDKQLYFVVWEDYKNRNKSGADIYGQFLDNSGTLCSNTPILISKDTTGTYSVEATTKALLGNQTAPDVAYKQDITDTTKSKLVVVWQDTNSAASGDGGYVGYAEISNLPDYTSCGTAATVSDVEYINYNPSKTAVKIESGTKNNAVFAQYSTSGITSNFGSTSNTPILPGTFNLKYGSEVIYADDGSGQLLGLSGGSINYSTGKIAIFRPSQISAAIGNHDVFLDATYQYYDTTGTSSRGDKLLSRKSPRISYDSIRDEFWVAWIESRDLIGFSFARCWGIPVGGEFGDSSFIGYSRLDGSTTPISPKANVFNVTGADVLRNESNGSTGTNRLISFSVDSANQQTYVYEFFKEISSVSIASDNTSPETLFVWEGKSDTAQLVCVNNNSSGTVTALWSITGADKIPKGPVGPTNSHIFGLFEKEILLPATYAKWIDKSTIKEAYASNPSVAVDTTSVPRKFLVAWEDNRDDATFTKVYGQLINSGGGLYNTNRLISYQNSVKAGNGTNSDNDDIIKNSRQTRPVITYDSFTQRFFVAWQDERNSSVSTGNIDLYGQFVNLDGSLSGANYALSTAPSNTLAPAVAYNPLFKQFLAVWKDSRNQSTTSSDIYAQRFTPGQPQMTLLNNSPVSPLTPAILNFGQVTAGTSSYKSILVRNTGDVDLVLQGITTSPAAPFSITPTTGGRLAPGAETTYTITYAPTASKTDNSSFIMSSDAGTQTVALSGSGVVPSLTGSVAALSFPSVDVNQTTSLPFVVSNNGLVDVTINGFSGLSAPFTVTDALNKPISQLTLAAGKSETYLLNFTPTLYGSFTGNVALVTSPQLTTPVTLTLAGTGLQAILALDQAILAFGNVNIGSSLDLLLTLSNTGNKPMTVSSISVSGAGYSFTPTVFSNISTNKILTNVHFAPTSLADYNSTMTVNTSGGNQTVSLTGKGVAGIASVSTTALDFGVVTLGSTPTKTITLTNTGEASLTVASVTDPADTSFTVISNNLPATLLKGTSVTITVQYTASTLATTNTSSMTIKTNAINGDIAIGLQGGVHGLSIASIPTTTIVKGTTSFSLGLSATGGSAPYAWTIIGGALPTGLTLNANTGIISGSPSSVGAYDFVVQVKDFANLTATRLFSIVVNDPATTVSGAVTFTLQIPTNPLTYTLPISYFQYGSVLKNSASTQILIVNNNTSRDISITSASIADSTYATNFAVPLNIAAGAKTSISVAFSPKDTSMHNSTLILRDLDGSSYTLPLYGSGATAVASLGASSPAPGKIASISSSSIPVTSPIITSSAKPATFTPSDAVAVRIENITANSAAQISVTFQTLPTSPVFYKIVNSVWKPLTNYTLTGNTLTFTLTDNDGVFDADITPGVIQDPLVVGYTSQQTTPTTTTSSNVAPAASAKKSGCFIATAAYGSYLDPHVMVLRHFRDDVLLQSTAGTAFVDFYYRYSPPVADFIAQHAALRMVMRLALTPLIFAVKYPLLAALLFVFAGAWLFRSKVFSARKNVEIVQAG